MTEEELVLLASIKEKLVEKPEFINAIMGTMTEGIVASVSRYREMAADMETLACMGISMAGEKRITKKTKEYFEALALSKLAKYEGATFSRWDWAYKKNKTDKQKGD